MGEIQASMMKKIKMMMINHEISIYQKVLQARLK